MVWKCREQNNQMQACLKKVLVCKKKLSVCHFVVAFLALMMPNNMKNASKNICKKEKNLDRQELERK